MRLELIEQFLLNYRIRKVNHLAHCNCYKVITEALHCHAERLQVIGFRRRNIQDFREERVNDLLKTSVQKLFAALQKAIEDGFTLPLRLC